VNDEWSIAHPIRMLGTCAASQYGPLDKGHSKMMTFCPLAHAGMIFRVLAPEVARPQVLLRERPPSKSRVRASTATFRHRGAAPPVAQRSSKLCICGVSDVYTEVPRTQWSAAVKASHFGGG
jgi:hypothetical protein